MYQRRQPEKRGEGGIALPPARRSSRPACPCPSRVAAARDVAAGNEAIRRQRDLYRCSCSVCPVLSGCVPWQVAWLLGDPSTPFPNPQMPTGGFSQGIRTTHQNPFRTAAIVKCVLHAMALLAFMTRKELLVHKRSHEDCTTHPWALLHKHAPIATLSAGGAAQSVPTYGKTSISS